MEERRKGLWHKSVTTVLSNKRLLIRAILSIALFCYLLYLTHLLFFHAPEDNMKDMINIMLGAVLMAFSQVISFWFKKDDEDKKEERADLID